MKKIWQEFCEKWGLGEKEKQRVPLLLAALLLGLGLMAAGNVAAEEHNGGEAGAVATTAANAVGAEMEAVALEERLAAVLRQVDGAGEVSVVVTLASRGRTEYAASASGGQLPVVESGLPTVQGVLVVADGADDVAVCRALSDAVVGLLDVPTHRVVVCRRQQ